MIFVIKYGQWNIDGYEKFTRFLYKNCCCNQYIDGRRVCFGAFFFFCWRLFCNFWLPGFLNNFFGGKNIADTVGKNREIQ